MKGKMMMSKKEMKSMQRKMESKHPLPRYGKARRGFPCYGEGMGQSLKR